MNPQELKSILSSGLLSFPVTDFDAAGDFNPAGYVRRLEWLAPYGASALFAAGGTGEFFSLAPDEYSAVIKTAVDTCEKSVPILAGVGGPTRVAIQMAQEAERLGAKGLLLLPHYLGVPVYSSAVFNFIPKTAMAFYRAIAAEDHATVGKLIDDFFLPYLDIRNRKAGYAVSIVKAGAKIVGYDAGPVRAPLTDLLPDEYEALAKLIEAQGAQ